MGTLSKLKTLFHDRYYRSCGCFGHSVEIYLFKINIKETMSLEQQIVGNKAKGRISKRVFQENKAHQIFRKTNISYPLIRRRTCAYQGVRNVRFSENLACFVFLKHPFRDSPFCLITDELLNQYKRILHNFKILQ